MLALISLILVLIGCANWLTIGLLQFDFVAGLFGSQSNIFSRIVYVVVGVAAIVLAVNIIKNKGKIGFNFKKLNFNKKKQPKLAKQMESSEDLSKNNHQYPKQEHSNKFNQEMAKDNHKYNNLSQQLKSKHDQNNQMKKD